jgi:hypothetical protein
MQYNFSLNNFGVSPSACNPGDGFSEVVLSCLIKGEKTKSKTNRKTKQNKTKYPKFKCNTVSVSPSTCSSSSVIVSSKREKKGSGDSTVNVYLMLWLTYLLLSVSFC